MTGTNAPDGAGNVERALFDHARAGLEVYDADLRIVRANPVILALRGLPSDRVIGVGVQDLDSGLPLSPIMREVVETGAAVVDRRMSAYPATDPEHRHEFVVTGYPLEDHGRSIGAAAMLHDVTEEVRRQKELDLLNIARSRIGSSLDALRTAQELVEMAVPGFADAVAVDLLESVLTGDAPVGPVAVRLPMRRAAFKAGEGRYGAYPVGAPSHFASPTPYTQALADLRPRLVESMSSAGGWLLNDPTRAEFIARSDVQSLIVAPLTVHGLVLGLASFYRGGSHHRTFDKEDMSLALQLAGCTAVCIDNARRFVREHTVATTLQRSLLPRIPPETAALESSHCYRPGRYGAHWFDVLPLSSCRVGLVIGYVPGEGLQASVAMGRLRTAASTLAAMDLPPDELLTHLDDAAQRMAREQNADPVTLHHGRPPFTASCLYLMYDPITRRCTAASAGHDSPLLTSPEGVVSRLEVPRGAPLGRGVPYELFLTELRAGSLLSLYSDGSTGRHPAEADARLSRLWDTVGDASTAPEDICDSVAYKVVRHGTPEDGAALLVARTRCLDPDHISSWTFPPEPLSVSKARRAARDRLEHWGLEEQTPFTDLVVSELATNVIHHATGPIRLRLILDRTLTVEVSDDADTAPHLRHARLQDEGGRGLFLVASLARHWGTRYEEAGKTIWAEQELPGA
ncbi:SpoIIE family protein phosphatase [Streptomyces sp. NBC_00316]|uniref:SpoIIE family protein phosphatase n=1 Tax=Streptomyces sp. NBC_00316 TaxID=2975710 RepID=UPI002E2AD684|nr:SpoIIE family protein phosphatase [Streptomyces sp. NBC_00316]